MVVDRLLKPKSKFAMFNNKDDYFSINSSLNLNHIYRSLDILALNKDNIGIPYKNQGKPLLSK